MHIVHDTSRFPRTCKILHHIYNVFLSKKKKNKNNCKKTLLKRLSLQKALSLTFYIESDEPGKSLKNPTHCDDQGDIFESSSDESDLYEKPLPQEKQDPVETELSNIKRCEEEPDSQETVDDDFTGISIAHPSKLQETSQRTKVTTVKIKTEKFEIFKKC